VWLMCVRLKEWLEGVDVEVRLNVLIEESKWKFSRMQENRRREESCQHSAQCRINTPWLLLNAIQ